MLKSMRPRWRGNNERGKTRHSSSSGSSSQGRAQGDARAGPALTLAATSVSDSLSIYPCQLINKHWLLHAHANTSGAANRINGKLQRELGVARFFAASTDLLGLQSLSFVSLLQQLGLLEASKLTWPCNTHL